MNKVYVVINGDYDGFSIVSIHRTESSALLAADNLADELGFTKSKYQPDHCKVLYVLVQDKSYRGYVEVIERDLEG